MLVGLRNRFRDLNRNKAGLKDLNRNKAGLKDLKTLCNV